MIKKIICLLLFGLLASALFLCSPTDEPNHKVVGEWETKIGPISDIIPNAYIINANIMGEDSPGSFDDSSYILLVTIEGARQDTQFYQEGFWEIDADNNPVDDTIILKGEKTLVIDTTTQELKPIPQVEDVPICTRINDNEWTITFEELLPVAEYIGIDINSIDPDLLKLLLKTEIVFKRAE